MIILKKMRWGNLFSYGENNEINFTNAPLTQIVGQNGHGKSSIALVLEEVLFNKNSKGIKKADILNRNNSAKSYYIELEFSKDEDQYLIKSVRGSTQTVKLYKNSEEISAHTSTGTYKLIEELIGFDHKVFGQIVYQSNSSSLEFLTATDGNRKKFLIDLLSLNKYVDALDVFKAASKEVSEQLTAISAKIGSVQNWLSKYSTTNLNPLEIKEIPDTPRELIDEVSTLKDKVANIDKNNRKIIQNNKYKEILDSINIVPEPVGTKPNTDTSDLINEKAECNKAVKDAEAFILKMRKLGTQCPTCLEPINSDKVNSIITTQQEIKDRADTRIKELTSMIQKLQAIEAEWKTISENRKQYEEYHSLYDPSVESTIFSKQELEKQIANNELLIADINKQIKSISEQNAKALAHNAKIEVIAAQMEDMRRDLDVLQKENNTLASRNGILQILIKTFSPTGLVAYKIECLIKDLEDTTNKYLADLSSGRFQITFKVEADKLNVIITDNGKDIDILALSGGERARVNTATLLGIRKLMQSLSNSRINLLILDETIENLDVEGKEKLVEVLLQEEHLNTFVVSHGFSHPLLEKITVIKTNNISRIE